MDRSGRDSRRVAEAGRREIRPGRRPRPASVVALLVLAMVSAVIGSSPPVGAQTPVDDPASLVVVPGACGSNGPLEPGWAVDCRFALRPGAAGRIGFAELADDEGQFRSCTIEGVDGNPGADDDGGGILRCPDLLDESYDQGTVSFTLWIDGIPLENAATVTTRWATDQRFDFFVPGQGEIVVFDGRPLRWFSFFYEDVDGLFVNIRHRDGGAVLATVEVPASGPFTSNEGTTDPELAPGRYRLWPCVGPTATSCVEGPGGRPFQVIDGDPIELVEGHNRVTAERINVVFFGSGFDRPIDDDPLSVPDLPELARQLLTIDGPVGVDVDGGMVDDGPADRLMWGPMAIEPLRSHLDRFNFWFLADDIADERGLLFDARDLVGDLGFDLPNLQITALYRSDVRFVSDARGTSFESPEPAEIEPRGRLRFGDARVWVPTYDPWSSAVTLAHEWGHGLFGLRDEYYGFDERPIVAGYPNCAPDLETAERWWADLAGQVDSFAEEVTAVESERLRDTFAATPDLVDRTTIEIVPGGCYSDWGSEEVYRPSMDSIMNSEVPVFGVVNRARVENVLARFSGRGPMGTLDDLALECEGESGRIDCSGSLRSHLDRPLSIVAVNSIPCEFGQGRRQADGSLGPVPVTCTTIGSPEPVSLTFKGERRIVEVLDLDPPLPVIPMEARLIPQDGNGAPADGSAGNGRAAAVGALLIVATVALGFVERRRRQRAQ